MIDIDQYLKEKQAIVNQAIQGYLPHSGPPVIREAMCYSLEAGGKRLRPILTLAVADTIGSEDSSVLDVACAIEMIHTYSLIHDDLPAMDDSDLRRGKPSCHRVYGEAMAILTGDGLLTLAFEVLAKFGYRGNRADKALRITAELAAASGITGMIGGQVLDLEAEGNQLTLSELNDLSARKTGALLKASVLCGGIAADASSEQLEMLEVYAASLGTAFQIVDDLLDWESSAEELGKPTGADQIRYKPTYPSVLGPEKAREKAEMLYEQAVVSIEELNRPTYILEELAKRLIFRKK